MAQLSPERVAQLEGAGMVSPTTASDLVFDPMAGAGIPAGGPVEGPQIVMPAEQAVHSPSLAKAERMGRMEDMGFEPRIAPPVEVAPEPAPVPQGVAPSAPRARPERRILGQVRREREAYRGLAGAEAQEERVKYDASQRAAEVEAEVLADAQEAQKVLQADYARKQEARVKKEEAKERAIANQEKISRYDMDLHEIEAREAIISSDPTSPQARKASEELRESEEAQDNRSMGERIAAGFAAALSGYSSAMLGTTDYVNQQIQQGIRENMDRQKERMAAREGRLGEYKTEYGRMLELHEDEAVADQAFIAANWKKAVKRAKIMSMKAGAAGAPGRDAAISKLEAKAKIEEEKAVGPMIEKAAMMEEKRLLARDAAAAKLRAARLKDGGASGLRIGGFTPTGETDITKDSIKKAKESKKAAKLLLRSLDEAMAIREEYGTEHFGGPVQKKMERLQDDMSAQLGAMGDAGVMGLGEIEVYKERVGDIAGIGWQMANLEALKEIVNMRVDVAMDAYGYKANSQDWYKDAAPTRSDPFADMFEENE